VTWNQTLEIVKENQEARAELEAFKQQKRQEREAEFQKQIAERKQETADAKAERIKELKQQKEDSRLPEDLRKEITQTFDLKRIISLLRDTSWFGPIGEGEGGMQAIYNLSGAMEKEGYPGTGMRRPNGALYNMPKSVRTSVINKGTKAGIIEEKNGGYSATELGKKLLVELDSCPECKEQRKPYHTASHYSMPGRWSSSANIGIYFHCECEIKKIYASQQGSNMGVGFTPFFKKKKESEK